MVKNKCFVDNKKQQNNSTLLYSIVSSFFQVNNLSSLCTLLTKKALLFSSWIFEELSLLWILITWTSEILLVLGLVIIVKIRLILEILIDVLVSKVITVGLRKVTLILLSLLSLIWLRISSLLLLDWIILLRKQLLLRILVWIILKYDIICLKWLGILTLLPWLRLCIVESILWNSLLLRIAWNILLIWNLTWTTKLLLTRRRIIISIILRLC